MQHPACPGCGIRMQPPRVSRSRYVEAFVCADCGTKEALEGFHWNDLKYRLTPPVAKHFDQSKFKPW